MTYEEALKRFEYYGRKLDRANSLREIDHWIRKQDQLWEEYNSQQVKGD